MPEYKDEKADNFDTKASPTIVSSQIHGKYQGSDHVPISLELEFPKE